MNSATNLRGKPVPKPVVITANSLDELIRAPYGANIVAPVSVWEDAVVDLEENVAEWEDIDPEADAQY